jgi:prophage tail gpP-like protein
MSDEVRVVINGKEFTGWEAVTLEMAVDHIADGLSITAPWDPARKELREAFRGYNPVELFIDDDLYLTGTVDKATPDLSKDDRKITVECRSLTGVLADCSHDGPTEYTGLALSTICRQVCKPFKVAVRADNDTAPIPEARAEYGQNAADFLNSLAAPRNILLNCSYKGELVLTWGGALMNRPPVARLVEGQYPVEAVGGSRDWTKLFSVYKVATQFAGVPDIIDVARDSSVRIYRPLLQALPDAAASPKDAEALAALDESAGKKTKDYRPRTAARLRAQAIAEACPVSVSLTGWRRPDGKRWAERQVVTLLAPSAMIYEEIAFVVSSCRLSMDASGGRATSLSLVLPETYSGTMPKDAAKLWA